MRHCFRKSKGFNFLEIIVFIVVIGILSQAMFVSFSQVLGAGSTRKEYAAAAELARERMELLLGQKRSQGFSRFTDPCNAGSPRRYARTPWDTPLRASNPLRCPCPTPSPNKPSKYV